MADAAAPAAKLRLRSLRDCAIRCAQAGSNAPGWGDNLYGARLITSGNLRDGEPLSLPGIQERRILAVRLENKFQTGILCGNSSFTQANLMSTPSQRFEDEIPSGLSNDSPITSANVTKSEYHLLVELKV